MKRLLGLVCFISLTGLAQADDFSLNFSSDIIDAAQPTRNELDALPLTSPEKQDNGVLPLLPETRTETKELQQPEADKKADGPVVKSRVRESRHFQVKKSVAIRANQFSPIQTGSADSFFAQYQRDVAPEMLLYPGSSAQEMSAAGFEPFDQLHEELRTLVGEDMYSRMVWAYLDVKELDNWIYATIDQSGLFAPDSLLVGLNDQLFAGLAVLTQSGADEKNADPFNDWQKGLQTQQAKDVKTVIDKEAMRANLESQSLFYAYLKYLTPLNFIYLILTIMALIYGGRFFRFMIRQQ